MVCLWEGVLSSVVCNFPPGGKTINAIPEAPRKATATGMVTFWYIPTILRGGRGGESRKKRERVLEYLANGEKRKVKFEGKKRGEGW
jgi:hypothetical protein